MKKLLLSVLTIASLSVFAQKDLEVTLSNPINGQNIINGKQFSLAYSIKNVGATDVPATDSLIVAIAVGGNVIQSTVQVVNHGGIAVGVAKAANSNFTLTFAQDVPNVSFCVLAVLRYNGESLDTMTNNNAGCATVNLLLTNTGINELVAESVKAYPNPANSVFTLTMNTANAKVDVLDITGKMVETAAVSMGEARFDVSNYKNGVYFYQIKDENNSLIKSGKFTVSH